MSSSSSNGIIGGFWPSWSSSKKPPSSIPTSYYTHVFYAFLNLDPSAYFTLKITQEDEKSLPAFTRHVHSNNSSVKAFLAIGGATAESAFSRMASVKINREYFIQSTIEVARKYGFDGVNLDWVFPYGEDGMANLVSLLTELRKAVDEEALQTGNTRLEISVSVFFAPDLKFLSSEGTVYPAKAIADEVDFLNVMCYDHGGSWVTTRTGAVAGLYSNSGPYSASYGIHKWMEAGVPPGKLVMGLTLYGRSWKLRDPKINGIGAPAFAEDEGYILYHTIVRFINSFNSTEVYDEETVSYYCYAGTSWISYDGPKSIETKVKYAKDHHLGGYYFWAIGEDYPDNRLSTAALEEWRKEGSK